MSKAVDLPVSEVKQWPLVLGLVLLASGAVLNQRLGNKGTALVLAALAVIIPAVGFGLRSYLSGSVAPRVRRVYVDEERTPIMSPTLESAKYLTPPPQSGLSDSFDGLRIAPPNVAELCWMDSDAECIEA
jgi:hypothetical protein